LDSTQAKQLRDSVDGKSIGGWKVVGYCGSGKSAIVLRATKDGVDGALKIFHPELIERFGKAVQLERINRERSLIGEHHPHLVRIFDGGECSETGHLFVVMEFLPYKNLQEVLQALPANAHKKLILQVASAAEFLEQKGMAHRDIKPENIAISDDFENAVLLDLGVILPIGLSELTDVDQRPFIGTLRYSSPEFLLRKEEPTVEGWRAVTFYQLGAVLHDMLMKRPIFHNHTEPFSKLVLAITGDEQPEITSDDEYCALLAKKALIKDPKTRLELVQWERFSKTILPPETNAQAVKQRVLERQQLALAKNARTGVAAVEVQRERRVKLMDFSNKLDSKIGTVLAEQACFPLRVIKPCVDVAGRCLSAFICFEKDRDRDLPLHLLVKIQINLIDENAGQAIYKVLIGSALSTTEEPESPLNCTSHAFSGTAEEFLTSAAIEEVLLAALDAAYNVLGKLTDPGISEFIVLNKE